MKAFAEARRSVNGCDYPVVVRRNDIKRRNGFKKPPEVFW